MTYTIEEISKALKIARKQKGISQRTLAKVVKVPQSHISKIENGAVDLRLSSLIEIARALDLELTLVPQKNVSAVKSIVRQTQHGQKIFDRTKELDRLKNILGKISHKFPEITEIVQIQRRVQDMYSFQLPEDTVRKLAEIRKTLDSFTKNSKNEAALQKTFGNIEKIRNQLAHQVDIPTLEKVRPAYSLEDDDHG